MANDPPQPPPTTVSDDDANVLLDIARQSIREAVTNKAVLDVDTTQVAPTLLARHGVFVTLRRNGELRGCIGTLDPQKNLAQDTAEYARRSATQDPRFPPMSVHELTDLDIHISVLSEPTPIEFTDEADLLAKIRPGVDGLLLETPTNRGTFLPAVWKTLPDPQQFLDHLKSKAGLPRKELPKDARVYRYTAQSIGKDEPA